jgi:hypothetical protein
MRSLRFSLLVFLLFARLAFAAAPRSGPEIPLTPVDDIPAPGWQYSPAIGSHGGEAFAVWLDSRSPSLGVLLGSRIADDGRWLDPLGVIIEDGLGHATREPQVAWNGGEWLVVSTEWNSKNFLYPTWGHRVSAEGKLLERFLLGSFVETKLASNGKEAVLVATIRGDTFLARLGSDGRIREQVAMNTSSPYAVVADGDDWVVFTRLQCSPVLCYGGLYQFRVKGRDVSYRQLVTPLPEEPFYLSAATDGNGRFLVTWNATSYRPQPPPFTHHYHVTSAMRFVMSDREGNVTTPTHTFEQFAAEYDEEFAAGARTIERNVSEPPGVAWFGDRFVLSWAVFDSSGASVVRALSIEPDGDPIERRPATVESLSEGIVRTDKQPVLAATRSRLHMVWPNRDRQRNWIAARSIASTSEFAAPFTATPAVRSASTQDAVETAAGADATFIVWTEHGTGEPRVRGRIVRHDGSESHVLDISQSALPAQTPAVAFADGVWLVAWNEIEYRVTSSGKVDRDLFAQHILARRYDANGIALDAAPLRLMKEHVSPGLQWRGPAKMSVGTSGSQFVVAWGGPPGGANDRNLRLVRVRTDGSLADAEPLYVFTGGDATRGAPHALWTGSDYFVLWQEEPFHSTNPPFHAARSARLGMSGALSQEFPELAATAADVWPSPFEPATNGREVLVTWSERRANETGCVFAQRFSFDGAPLAPREELLCAAGLGALPARSFALWDGAQFRVFYSHDDTLWVHTIGSGERVAVLETSHLVALARPVVTPAGIVVAYTRVDAAFGSVPHVFRRTISFGPGRRRSVR